MTRGTINFLIDKISRNRVQSIIMQLPLTNYYNMVIVVVEVTHKRVINNFLIPLRQITWSLSYRRVCNREKKFWQFLTLINLQMETKRMALKQLLEIYKRR